DELRLLDLLIRARPAARPEHRRQPGDARGVSRAIAAVDVVAADDRAGELLRDEVHLVRALRAAEEPERARAVLGHEAPEIRRGPIERFVPGGRTQRAVGAVPHHGLGQSAIALRHADSLRSVGAPPVRRALRARRPLVGQYYAAQNLVKS